jgi:hypothetical protein
LAATLSALIPGLGQAYKRQLRLAGAIGGGAACLLLLSWWASRSGGAGAGLFVLMLIMLPAWVIQSYNAFLPPQPESASLASTLREIGRRGHDLRFLGALFLLTAATDVYIIVANPSYALTVFCAKPAGIPGLLAKAQSPTLHVLIGYGFLRLRRWALFLYLAYAGFGLLNATANFACFGYGRVRTVFMITLIAFTAYVYRRRAGFERPRGASRSF